MKNNDQLSHSCCIGTTSGSNSPTSDSASVQRADASLNNCEGAAGSTSDKSR